MFTLIKRTALLFVVCLLVGSCADLNPDSENIGPLAMDDRVLTDSIPAEYGDLISVTTAAEYPGIAQLWFQKDDKTIVTVFVHYNTHHLNKSALLIPRS